MKTKLLSLILLFSLGVHAQLTKSFADHWKFRGIAVEEPGYHLWGASPIWGEDGKVHLFIARWKTEYAFDPGWRSHSEIAHYTSDTPQGPFHFSNIVLNGSGKDTWDKCGIHNPAIHKVGNKYVLLYISNNNYQQPPHPANQRIGMLISDNLYGPWKKAGKDGCILSPSSDPEHWTYQAKNGVNNPAFLQHPDGRFLLYFKSQNSKMGLAFANQLEGPYTMSPKPVTQNKGTIEDGYAFIMNNKICLLTTDNHGIIERGGGILWKSDDGLDFNEYEAGFHLFSKYLPKETLEKTRQIYGALPKFERPQVLMKNGKPAYLYVPSGANIKGGKETLVHVLEFTEDDSAAYPTNGISKNKTNTNLSISKKDDLNLATMMQAADSSCFVRDTQYFNWCNSIIKDEKGVYHLFYARWPKQIGFFAWLTHSEIAHATALRPEGPYRNGKTILKTRPDSWDKITMHNVQVDKFGDQYYLYYISTNAGNKILDDSMLKDIGTTGYTHQYWNLLRSNQRAGVAFSSSLNGPWTRFEKPMIEPHGPIKTVTVNPSVCQGKDNKYHLIIKGDDRNATKKKLIQAVGISNSPTGPFQLEDKPAFSDIPTEDACLWYDSLRERYYAVFHAHGGNFIGLITSTDGKNWQKARHYEVCKKQITLKDGSIMKVDRMERPYMYLENGKPTMLSFAVKKGNDAFIVFFPLKQL